MTVARNQRHTRQHRCPICGGADEDPRGKDKRCSGFTSTDGWVHCSRDEHAGGIEPGPDGLYAHRPAGPCKCGLTHSEDTRQRDNIEGTYPYEDEHGRLLSEVVRFEGKKFRQRHPDGAGGWIWKLEGVRLVPFRLPELITADSSKPVYICEGEKDVLTLVRLGHVATCNPMGAGKWGKVADEARKVLAGRDVIVIADADDVGRKHARQIEESLRDVVRSIVVSECPKHKDVTDMLSAGGSLDDLVPLKVHEPSPIKPLDYAPHVRVADDWRGLLVTTENPKTGEQIITPNLSNAIVILRNHPAWRGVLGWNSFAERFEFRSAPPWSVAVAHDNARAGALRETDVARIVDWFLRSEYLTLSTKIVELAIPVAAEADEFHPVRERLSSLKWDGVERLPSWLPTYCGTKADAYTATVGTRWMISAVARVFEPGCQVDTTLIFETRQQGTGKNSAFRALALEPEWFSETGIVLGDKDSYQSLRGKWLYLFDELDSLSKPEVTRVKGFLTSTRDHYRPSYGRVARDFLRQTVFCGTTNKDHYLLDATGNRRFWPVKCGSRIDHEGIARDRDQLWAEAVVRYHRGEKWYADTAELRALCEGEQAERVQQDDWIPIIAQWLQNPDHEVEDFNAGGHPIRRRAPFMLSSFGPSTAEILEHAVNKQPGQIRRDDSMRAAEALRALGYGEPIRKIVNGVDARRYPSPSLAQPLQPKNEVGGAKLEATAQPKTSPIHKSLLPLQPKESHTQDGKNGGIGAGGCGSVTTPANRLERLEVGDAGAGDFDSDDSLSGWLATQGIDPRGAE